MFSHFRVQRRFAEMEVLKTLSQDRVHQRLGEQIIRRSEALLEASRRFWAQVVEEEAEEEETEERRSLCTFAHSYDELHPDVQGQW